jgi:hypothetical protein
MIHASSIGKLGGIAATVMFSAMLALGQPNNASGSEAAANSGNHRTMTGSVSCAAKINHLYTCKRYDTLQSCTLSCVQAGSKFALVVGDTSYVLQGDPKELGRFAGGKATVSGSLMADEIQVASVSNPVRQPEMLRPQEQPAINAGR